MLWLKGTVPLDDVTFFGEGWIAARGPSGSAQTTVELREAFANVSLGNIELRVGRQILAWGRADGVNPTGNLVAEDITLLTPDDADRRLGTTTAAATYYFGGLALSGVWMPEFRGDRFPIPPASNLAFDEVRTRWPGDQWALRAERTGGAVDWSMSLFQGLDESPDLDPAGAGVVSLRHRRIRAIGADAARSFGRYGFRAEAAYVRTQDGRGNDAFTKNPFIFAVVGVDRTFLSELNMNVQYIGRVVEHLGTLSPGMSPEIAAVATEEAIFSSQTRRVQHGASMRASYKWLHETLETEWAAVIYAAPYGTAMRPKVTYALTDRLTFVGGSEILRGERRSLFGLLRPNSTMYAEMRWGF
jgi:hypothetical protein